MGADECVQHRLCSRPAVSLEAGDGMKTREQAYCQDQVGGAHLDHGAIVVDAALGRHGGQAAVLSCSNIHDNSQHADDRGVLLKALGISAQASGLRSH